MKSLAKIKQMLEQNPILIGIMSLLVIFGIFAGAFATYLVLTPDGDEKQNLFIPDESQISIQDQENKPADIDVSDLLNLSEKPVTTTEVTESEDKWSVDDTVYRLTIEWQKTQEVDITKELSEQFKTPEDMNLKLGQGIDFERFYKKGTVKSGKFAGLNLYALQTDIDGMCFGRCQHETLLLANKNGGELYLITSEDAGLVNPDSFYGYEMPVEVYYWLRKHTDTALINVTISNLTNYPDTLQLENGALVQRLEYFDQSAMPQCDPDSCLREKPIAKTKQGNALFGYESAQSTDMEGALYIYNELGIPFAYGSLIGGSEADMNSNRVQWNNEYKQSDIKYAPYRPGGGCGFHNAIDVLAQSDLNKSDLVIAGKASDGKSVYVPKDSKNNQDVLYSYDGWMQYDTEEKPSIDEFLKDHPTPVFYWQDALGRWVRYVELATHPLVECGKPVIYLYPETTTNVSVKLPNFIQVTVSDPAYPQTGWNVIANPDGSLIYPADGKTYGSLFWEGIGAGYARPHEGWVIKDGEQENFLAEILPKYGLNTREAQEFMDFWLPEMQGAKYYRISFLTDVWDKAAPLNVTPAPDTNIRIFMDWQKIDAPRQISPPDVVTPERKGFTLVEWGGVLYK
ncbi:MAG: hypothetical protein ACOYUZ_05935 [Patescibacteria group bacterium]